MSSMRQATEAVAALWLSSWIDTRGAALTPTIFENDASAAPSTPADLLLPPYDVTAASWCRLTFRTLLSTQESMGQAGDRRWARRALAIVQLFTPPDVGSGAALDLAQRAMAIFEGAALDPDIWFGEVTPREIGVDGRWFQVNVNATFNYYEQK